MNRFGTRGYACYGFIFLGFLVIACKLFEIQILRHTELSSLAIVRRTRKVRIPARRGEILSRHNRPVAVTVRAKLLFVDPRIMDVKKKVWIARRLAEAFALPYPKVNEKVFSNTRYEVIGRDVSEEQIEQLSDVLRERGVGLQNYLKRGYPFGKAGAHIIGFCSRDMRGLAGIELYYDRTLSGTDGVELIEVDSRGRGFVKVKDFLRRPKDGENVVLTLDMYVQGVVERALDGVMEKWNPVSAVAVVMNPNTGEVLAMGCRPTFTPDLIHKLSPEEVREVERNRAVVDLFEPGSTMKPFVLYKALEVGMVTLEQKIYCENGLYVIGPRRLRDHRPFGWLEARDVVVQSSNCGIAKIAVMLGARGLREIVCRTGLNSRSGIDFPGEQSGFVYPLDKWTIYSVTSVPIGQEVLVTPISLLRAYCAIANGGYLVKPVLTLKVGEKETKREKKLVLDPQLVQKLKDVLREVVARGTGKRARLQNYSVAGKTGTSQLLERTESGKVVYSRSKFVASFCAFAPVERPRVALLVSVREPRGPGSHYGGSVAAPVAKEILGQVLPYLEAGPEGRVYASAKSSEDAPQ